MKAIRYVFFGVGGLMIIGGVILTFDDPAGLILVFMGLVFAGIAWIVTSAFEKAGNMKRIPVSASQSTSASVARCSSRMPPAST